MRHFAFRWISVAAILCVASFAGSAQTPDARSTAQGTIDFVARVTPTGGRAEPVRQFTFYLLKKSFAEIRADAEAAAPKPDLGKYIDGLKVSDELKDWMKEKKTVNLDSPDIVPMLTADDILKVPEFLAAYLKSNSGLNAALPHPKYKDGDREKNPAKYDKQKEEYHTALHKYIADHPLTLEGIETALESVSPQRAWAQMNAEHDRRLERRLTEIAQTRYLVAKTETDLEGRAFLSGVPAGTFWLSTLGLKATAGDAKLRWDVEVMVQPGQTARLELSNLNAADLQSATP